MKKTVDNSTFEPYLSVVASSRNDDHGGDPLIRTQIFINCLAWQCEKERIPTELILVDWNPVKGRPGLSSVLSLPPETTYCKAYVVTVPTALHKRLKYSEQLPLFQMIAKNVGIRRAKGKFILATNIDIIFSNELFQCLGEQDLDPKKVYRVDRYDIESGLTKDAKLEEVLDYAWTHPVRSHRRYAPEQLVVNLYGLEVFKRVCLPEKSLQGEQGGVKVVLENGTWQIRPQPSVAMNYLHTNACGDFTLLSREGWDAIRGYPEFASYSFNIDSVGLLAAHYSGFEEVSLLPPCVCFHIEHGVGSGWTPEGEKLLFDRLRKSEILNPEWSVLTPLVDEMREKGKALEFNHRNWGLADFNLPLQILGDQNPIPASQLTSLEQQAENREISAIQPRYDLDRLTLVQERKEFQNKIIVAQEGLLGQIPNSIGEGGLTHEEYLAQERQLFFEQSLAHEQRLAEERRMVYEQSLAHEQRLVEERRVAHEKRLASIGGGTVGGGEEVAMLYIPDSNGHYSEDWKVMYPFPLKSVTNITFRLNKFPSRFPLRLDPCQQPGLVKISSIQVVDFLKSKVVLEFDGRHRDQFVPNGTAVWSNSPISSNGGVLGKVFAKMNHSALSLTSTGLDPQLLFPRFPENIGFPLLLSVEMKVVPFNGS